MRKIMIIVVAICLPIQLHASLKQWEYKTLNYESRDVLMSEIESLGVVGWELVTCPMDSPDSQKASFFGVNGTVGSQAGRTLYCILKRRNGTVSEKTEISEESDMDIYKH
jgi:hypothetical protein